MKLTRGMKVIAMASVIGTLLAGCGSGSNDSSSSEALDENAKTHAGRLVS